MTGTIPARRQPRVKHEPPAAGQLDDDTVLADQAEFVREPAGERVGAGRQRAVGEPDVAVDQRDRAGRRVGGGEQLGAERQSPPPAPRGVGPGELLGPRNDALGDRGDGASRHDRTSLSMVRTVFRALTPTTEPWETG